MSIGVIDEDLGRSGSGSEARPEFGKLLAVICEGKVGAVLALEASPLVRKAVRQADGTQIPDNLELLQVEDVLDLGSWRWLVDRAAAGGPFARPVCERRRSERHPSEGGRRWQLVTRTASATHPFQGT